MSHFTVLVIGDNIEEQLAPYSEQICVEKYKKGEVSQEDKDQMLDYYKRNKGFEGTFEECYAQYGEDWNGNYWEQDENGVWCEYSTYNPKSQWDWYQVGGRWSGFFKLKEGAEGMTGEQGIFKREVRDGYVDSAKKKDIDFESMRNVAGEEAAAEYDRVFEIIKDTELNESWEQVRERFGTDKIDEARKFYGSQERVVAFQKAYNSPFVHVEQFNIPREEFIRIARDGKCSTYAVVKNGEWFEKGEMGWFGISVNEQDQNTWNQFIVKTLEETGDDELITLVDCHI